MEEPVVWNDDPVRAEALRLLAEGRLSTEIGAMLRLSPELVSEWQQEEAAGRAAPGGRGATARGGSVAVLDSPPEESAAADEGDGARASVPEEERAAAIERYLQSLGRGLSGKAAAAEAGFAQTTITRWIEQRGRESAARAAASVTPVRNAASPADADRRQTVQQSQTVEAEEAFREQTADTLGASDPAPAAPQEQPADAAAAAQAATSQLEKTNESLAPALVYPDSLDGYFNGVAETLAREVLARLDAVLIAAIDGFSQGYLTEKGRDGLFAATAQALARMLREGG